MRTAGQFAESEAGYPRALSLVEKNEGQSSLDYAVMVSSMDVLPMEAVVSEELSLSMGHKAKKVDHVE
jgi:hypothetical protein